MSSPFWCHTCHGIVRIASSLSSVFCPACGTGFVEEVRSFLFVTGSFRSSDLLDEGDGSPRDISAFRSSSARRGFLGRLFRGNRSSRQASEGRSPLLQILEANPPLQRSRNVEVSEDPTEPHDSSGVSSVLGARTEEGSSNAGISAAEVSDSAVEDLHEDPPSPRSLETVVQRLVAGIMQGGRSGSLPASKAAIAAMPTFKISEHSLGSDAGGALEDQLHECAVCKDVFEIGGEVKEMPCKHFYHSDCILPWLALHSSCPLCRCQMPVDEDEQPASTAGEPTVVIIGIAGSGVLLYNFILLGTGGQNENTDSTTNVEGEEDQASGVSAAAGQVETESGGNMAGGDVSDPVARMGSEEGRSFESDRNLSSYISETADVTDQSGPLENENRYLQDCEGHAKCSQLEEYGDRSVSDNMPMFRNEPEPSNTGERSESRNETNQLQHPNEDDGDTSTDTSSGSRNRSFLSWFL